MSEVFLAVRDLFLPRRCLACLTPLEGGWPRNVCDGCIAEFEELSFEGERVCEGCAQRMKGTRRTCRPCRKGERAFSRAVSFGAYDGALKEAILRFKGEPALGAPMGQLLLRAVATLPPFDVIVPVPLHPERLFSRGFNQSAFLARELADALDAPMIVDALRRTRNVEKQSKLTRKQRRRAARGTVEATRPIAGTVLVVDDVLTTGATLGACAMALRKAGASDVYVATLARAEES